MVIIGRVVFASMDLSINKVFIKKKIMKALLFFYYTKLIVKSNLNLDMVVHVCISQLYVTATKIPEATNFIKRNSLEPYMDYLDHTPQSQGAS